MFKRLVLFILFISALLATSLLTPAANAQSAPQRPFPQHVTYAAGTLRPTNFTQAQQDDHVRTFYDYWKGAYLAAAGTNSSNQPLYRIRFGKSGANADATVSEGQGYGMVITALMAGYDPNAQAYFDGLWRFARTHPSGIDNRLMSWKIVNGAIVGGNASAFDGDADIAYGLLLAHAQWGSSGAINYQTAAAQVLEGVLASTIGPQSRLPTLGDWVSANGSPHSQYTPRSSDFMLAHFRTYGRATNNPVWNTVATNVQAVIDHTQSAHSTTTGLLPDFMVNCNPITSCTPSPASFLEGPYDGHYYYNAGRNPWRIGLDVLLNGNPAAQTALQKSVRWLANATAGNAQNIKAGYLLNGTAIGSYFTTFFVAPFGVAAMTDPTQQAFLNNIYASVYNTREDYYEDSVNLMALLAMTGNYWDPAPATVMPTATPTATPLTPFPTATPTATPTQTATPPSGTCLVTYRVDPDWGSGFTAELTVTNLTGAPLNGWTLTWTFPDNQQITAAWSSSVTQSGNSVQARNASWNGNVAHGATFGFGFNANYSGSNRVPTNFALNGAPCNPNGATPTPVPTHTPVATATPTVTPTPTTGSAVIFADGFEAGNLDGWTARIIDDGDLSVTATAALVGSFGMNALLDDNVAIYVTDDRPNGETGYRASFRFDPNTITMASGDAHILFYGYTGASTQVLRLELRYLNSQYQLRAALRDDANTWKNSAFFGISDASHLIQFDWRAATSAGANNGSLAFRVDGVVKANQTGVDNDTRRIDRVRLGAVAAIDAGTRGSYFFDDFASSRLPATVTAAGVAEEAPEDRGDFLEEVTAEELAEEAAEAMNKQLFLPLVTR